MLLIRALPPKAYEEPACRGGEVESSISLLRFAEARSEAEGEAQWAGEAPK